MELEARLRAFAAFARRRSFSAAAAELRISQPAVSKHVADLERALGLKLVERARRDGSLTSAGDFIANYVLRAESLLAQADLGAAQFRKSGSGSLAIVASWLTGTYLLPELIAEFRHLHPAVHISLELGTAAQAVEWLRSHRAELGFIAGAIGGPEIEAEPLLEYDIVIVGQPALVPVRSSRESLEALTWISRPVIARKSRSADLDFTRGRVGHAHRFRRSHGASGHRATATTRASVLRGGSLRAEKRLRRRGHQSIRCSNRVARWIADRRRGSWLECSSRGLGPSRPRRSAHPFSGAIPVLGAQPVRRAIPPGRRKAELICGFDAAPRAAAKGHEDQFRPPSLSGRCRLGNASFPNRVAANGLLYATAGRLKGRGISSSTTLCAPWTRCVPEPSGSIGSRMTIRLDPLLRCPKGPVAPITSPPAARRERECAAKPQEGERSPCLPG